MEAVKPEVITPRSLQSIDSTFPTANKHYQWSPLQFDILKADIDRHRKHVTALQNYRDKSQTVKFVFPGLPHWIDSTPVLDPRRGHDIC